MSVERTQMGEYERTQAEVATMMDTAIVSATTKAELDQQIVTARDNPRSIKRFVTECMDLACLSEEVASECYYVLPRAGKNIEGPSVRLAEIVQYAWGNSIVQTRIVEEGEEYITAQGGFYDLQNNNKIIAEVRTRITDKYGKRYNADMIGVTGNATASKARRNAIFAGIPKALWNNIYLAARKCAAGNIKSLVTNRTEALNYLARKGVTEAVVIAALGVGGIEDIGIDELATLRGMVTAIKDEGVAIEEAFAPKDAPVGKPKTAAPKAKAKPAAAPVAETEADDEEGDADDDAPEPTRVSARTTDSVVTLSDAQRRRLTAKAQAEGVPLASLLTHFRIDSLDALPQYEFATAYTWLGSHA